MLIRLQNGLLAADPCMSKQSKTEDIMRRILCNTFNLDSVTLKKGLGSSFVPIFLVSQMCVGLYASCVVYAWYARQCIKFPQ